MKQRKEPVPYARLSSAYYDAVQKVFAARNVSDDFIKRDMPFRVVDEAAVMAPRAAEVAF